MPAAIPEGLPGVLTHVVFSRAGELPGATQGFLFDFRKPFLCLLQRCLRSGTHFLDLLPGLRRRCLDERLGVPHHGLEIFDQLICGYFSCGVHAFTSTSLTRTRTGAALSCACRCHSRW